MDTPLSLTIVYTGGIGGDLALLPRLHTFLQRLKAAGGDKTLLLDLGGACSAAAWHCRATGNRSALTLLDGMGYDAANIAGALTPADRAKLEAAVAMRLLDGERDWLQQPLAGAPLCISLKPAGETRLAGSRLRLARVSAGQVGLARLQYTGAIQLRAARIHRLPPRTPPNPSIAGAVDFVLSEARLYAQKRG